MRFRMDFSKLPKCNAKTKHGKHPCRHIALANNRCHYHGGKTPVKHGAYTRKSEKELAESRDLMKSLKQENKEMKDLIQGIK